MESQGKVPLQLRERFENYLKSQNLKMTGQRLAILEEFLCHDGHVSAEDFYHSIRERHPNLGLATVFRNLKLLCEAGLASEVFFDSRTTRYEILKPGSHHDHIRCVDCGLIIEFKEPAIEALQEAIAKRHGVELLGHRLDLYGRCGKCKAKEAISKVDF